MTIKRLMITWCVFCIAVSQPTEIDYAWQEIENGDIMAWGRHITGQDTDTHTTWHEFKSIAILHGRSAKANGDIREDDELWAVVDRGELGTFIECFQALDWGDDDDYCWFVDCGIGDADSHGRDEIPAVPETPGTYQLSYISENGALWAVPIGDGVLLSSLDVGGVARDVGGGIVGLPYEDHPFTIGNTIRITGTTNYNGQFVLGAGTTEDELQITAVYFAETFDGTEVIMIYITMPVAGVGRMDSDSDGNMYCGHNWYAAGSTYATKVEPDGTKVYNFLNHSWSTGSNTITGLKVFGDYLYIAFLRNVEKYDLTTKNLVWTTTLIRDIYNLDLDADGNAYVQSREGALEATGVLKLSVTDGSVLTKYTNSQGIYDVCVDDDLDVVIAGGFQASVAPTGLYNLSIRTLDNASGATLALGGTYYKSPLYYTYVIGTECIVAWDGYIYVLMEDPSPQIHKLDTDLNIIDTISAPTYAAGLFVSIWDTLVVINQGGGSTDIIWFYDQKLKYLSKIDNMYISMLSAWGPTSYLQGNIVFDGELTPGTPEIPGVDANWVEIDHLLGEDVCVYADGRPLGVFTVTEDANGTAVIDLGAEYDVVIAGINYYSIYESFPLVPKGYYSSIKDLKIDFFESMGCHVGVTLDDSVDWIFSYDDFATAIDPVTEIKQAPFVWGNQREPTVYLHEWTPVPMTLRGIYPLLNLSVE